MDWKDFEAREPLPPLVRTAKPAAHDDLIDKLIEVEAARAVGRREAKAAAPAALQLEWVQCPQGSRIVAMLGKIECGAIFPDGDGPGCDWSLWVGGTHGPHKRARSIEAAKTALEKAFAERTSKEEVSP